jgi:hypothetical protein
MQRPHIVPDGQSGLCEHGTVHGIIVQKAPTQTVIVPGGENARLCGHSASVDATNYVNTIYAHLRHSVIYAESLIQDIQ